MKREIFADEQISMIYANCTTILKVTYAITRFCFIYIDNYSEKAYNTLAH